ncbi:MAG: translation initiation factor IF-3 [Chthoniobacterales bacterium]|nr:translation initiation factor IF-3 [Chthoniobacterales bacterium]
MNDRIRSREVRVIIGSTGQQLGILNTDEAIRRAKSYGLDLIEVAPTANPPVCRIADFGKFKYELTKKEKESKHSATKIKEIKFRVKIGAHDYETKLRHAEEFIEKGNKLKIVLQFRGRENAHKDLGLAMMYKIKQDLETMALVDMPPKIVGRAVGMTMSPLPAAKRKRKYAKIEEEYVEDVDSDEDEEETEETAETVTAEGKEESHAG